MSENNKKTIKDILKANRKIILTLLGMPIFGMIVALGLVFYKRPDNLVIIVAVIIFFIVQYSILIQYFNKRINSLTEKDD